ncbi:MAG: discoidin domain-containing protein [Elusimicrobiota bacterium]
MRCISALFLVLVIISADRLLSADNYLYALDGGARGRKARIIDAVASTPKDRNEVMKAVDGDLNTRWSSQPTDSEWIEFTLEKEEVIDRVVIHWEAAFGETYQIQASVDGKNWFVLYNAVKKTEGRHEITFRPVSARYVRIYGVSRGTIWGYSIFECEIYSTPAKAVPIAEYARPEQVKYSKSDMSPSAYYYLSAGISPAGYYPGWLNKKQSYWATTGSLNGKNETLVSEDGTIDPSGAFVLMPYLYMNNRLITSRDAALSRRLEEGYMPIPSVQWGGSPVELTENVFSFERAGKAGTCVLFSVKNISQDRAGGKFYIAVRSFQLNPPWMFGGFGKVYSAGKSGNTVIINGKPRLFFTVEPDGFGASDYSKGEIIEDLKNGMLPQATEASDDRGFVSCAAVYVFDLPAGGSAEYSLIIPDDDGEGINGPGVNESIPQLFEDGKREWREILNKAGISAPDKLFSDAFRANQAYIILNYDERAFMGGPRNYERSWMRDGSIMAAAMLRCGHFEMVKRYIGWLVSMQRKSGEIPPIMELDGKPRGEREYDNQGEFLFTAAEYYRFTKDKEYMKQIFPSLIKAVEFIESLRNQRTTAAYRGTRFYGILPTSISHEGFPDPGAHSYFDDWWALKGIKDAVYIAKEIGEQNRISWMNRLETDLRASLAESIRMTRKEMNVPFIPSSAEGHQDACGNSVSVWPTEEISSEILPLLDSWYKNVFLPDRKREIRYNFTPYEMRIANAYLMLGHPDKTNEMLDFYLSVMRPLEWKVWAEAVTKDMRENVYLGDLPHTWISAIYINTARNMFAYEKGGTLVMGAGIRDEWLNSPEGVSVENLPTYFGKLNYTIQKAGNTVKFKAWGDIKCPDGMKLKLPALKRAVEAKSGRKTAPVKNGEITIDRLPAEIEISMQK